MKIVLSTAWPARLSLLSLLSLLSAAAAASGVAVKVVDAAGKPLADAVLYAEPEAGAAVPRPLKAAEIVQKRLRFLPLVSVIQSGATVAFPNNDKVRHHIYSFSPAKKFDQKLYSGVAAAPQVFDKAGTVVLGCNIHDRMIAYVKVVDTPYFARSDAAGMTQIDLPGPGKYTVKAWHYNMSGAQDAAQQVAVAGADASATVSFSLATKAPLAGEPPSPGKHE